jgi:hypothetical protein
MSRMTPAGLGTARRVRLDTSRGRAWPRLLRSPRILAVAGITAFVACGSACADSLSTNVPSSKRSAGAFVSPACALMTASQASRILGRPVAAVPTKPDRNGDSSCQWHASVSPGVQSSLSIFLYHNANAVRSFNSNLVSPQTSVLKISIDGSPALWRPYSGPGGGTAFVSAATHESLISVEAAGVTMATDGIAKAAMATALDSLHLHEH